MNFQTALIMTKSDGPPLATGPSLFELVNPHILTTPVLLSYLTVQCHIHQELDLLSRQDLLGLFINHVSPKPQRNHRDNRRGVVLKRLQAKKDKGKERDRGDKVQVSEVKPANNAKTHQGTDNFVEKRKSNGDSGEVERKRPKITWP